MKILLITEPAMHTDPTDERLARLVGAVAPWGDVTLLLTGGQWPTTTAWAGVTDCIVIDQADLADWPSEDLATLIVALAGDFSHIVAAASTFGATVLPRVAALLNRAMVTGVQKICAPDTFIRPVRAGNALATVQVSGPVCLTLHPSSFAPMARIDTASIPIRHVVPSPGMQAGLSRLLERIPILRGKRPDLASAQVVVAGGGGLAKAGHFAMIEALADTLGAAVGASRAAVDAEWAPSAWQIGQTGHIIAPDLYIGIGISGAIQHLAGIKEAKTIVAINHDPTAPLMCVADFALEADLYEAVPALIQAWQDRKVVQRG
ncbi:MAG: electron transfer flavoprotein subunit alpha/FixB family protein [Magnetococcales bacterium]|nr:electron transfer flavoprotein subunit alpha/FixB family protein [Magnetococcales bacterium]